MDFFTVLSFFCDKRVQTFHQIPRYEWNYDQGRITDYKGENEETGGWGALQSFKDGPSVPKFGFPMMISPVNSITCPRYAKPCSAPIDQLGAMKNTR
jgi:hypothetical protein